MLKEELSHIGLNPEATWPWWISTLISRVFPQETKSKNYGETKVIQESKQ